MERGKLGVKCDLLLLCKLERSIDHLTTAIHSVVWIHAVRAKRSAIHRIFGELRLFETISPAAEPTATFGLLAFWIGHSAKFRPGF